ncbi:MAG: GlcG/HbpS family heme-binding protein, partial [Pyrinomonadaceae bacterium]
MRPRITQRLLLFVFTVGLLSLAVVVFSIASSSSADGGGKCRGLPTEAQLKQHLAAAPNAGGPAGGLFDGERMWAAVVNRDGELCAYTTSTADPSQVWPGSQAIAKSKAYTANAFSLDALALSTARLYTFTQPGHSLWSLGHSNTFEPRYLAPPSGEGGGRNQITGGQIFFGGGVPLYRDGRIIGGLGISGDTSCT